MTQRIEDFRNTTSGPVALLGGGASVKRIDLDAIAGDMPIIGINESWRGFQTRWRVVVDTKDNTFPGHETCLFFPIAEADRSSGDRIPQDARVPIRHIPRNSADDPPFMGFSLDEGTYAYFGGMLALEVATWCGFDEIHLLGYDCKGGYWMDDDRRTPGAKKTHAIWERQLITVIEELRQEEITIHWR